jgi:cysteine desulfurase
MRQIYLDYNATTPIAPSVVEEMTPFLTEHFGNASSMYARGRAAAEAIEDARMRVASIVGANQDEIVFTSGGTESNNLAIKGAMLAGGNDRGGHIVISGFEHPSVTQPTRFLENLGFEVSIAEPDRHGIVQPAAVERVLTRETRLVSVMHANNEIGTIQPLRQIAELCRSNGVLLHTDAAQSVGKVRTMIDELNVDLLSIAGHKLYAPKGVGALFVREELEIEPLMHGAGQEFGLRAGTENTASIVALGKACSIAHKCLDEAADRMSSLRDKLASLICSSIPHSQVNGLQAPRLPNTLSITLPRISGTALLNRIPELSASTGSACHSGAEDVSPTLHALGMTAEQARGTLRLSVGWYTSAEDIDCAAGWIIGAWEAMQ